MVDRGLATKLETSSPERKTDVINDFGNKRGHDHHYQSWLKITTRLLLHYYEIGSSHWKKEKSFIHRTLTEPHTSSGPHLLSVLNKSHDRGDETEEHIQL